MLVDDRFLDNPELVNQVYFEFFTPTKCSHIIYIFIRRIFTDLTLKIEYNLQQWFVQQVSVNESFLENVSFTMKQRLPVMSIYGIYKYYCAPNNRHWIRISSLDA